MNDQTIREVEQFLYREARLLDDRQFHQWLTLLTDDIRYWMPTRTQPLPRRQQSHIDPRRRPPRSRRAIPPRRTSHHGRGQNLPNPPHRPPRLRHGLGRRSPLPHPPLHHQHRSRTHPRPTELKAYSNFLLYRTRGETEQDLYPGNREDLLRRENGQLKIAHRKITLAQTTLLAKNVSNFF